MNGTFSHNEKEIGWTICQNIGNPENEMFIILSSGRLVKNIFFLKLMRLHDDVLNKNTCDNNLLKTSKTSLRNAKHAKGRRS